MIFKGISKFINEWKEPSKIPLATSKAKTPTTRDRTMRKYSQLEVDEELEQKHFAIPYITNKTKMTKGTTAIFRANSKVDLLVSLKEAQSPSQFNAVIKNIASTTQN